MFVLNYLVKGLYSVSKRNVSKLGFVCLRFPVVLVIHCTKFSVIFFCLILTAANAEAQSLSKPVTLIEPTLIDLDTNFNTPVKPLPFDRYFRLRFSIPGKVNVLGFLIVPIDNNGNKDVKKRDYRRFIKSSTVNSRQRKRMKGEVPYHLFKDSSREHAPLNTEFEVYYKDKKSEVILLVPPLEPGRDYRIRLYTNDDKSLDLYYGLNAQLYQVLSMKNSVNLAVMKSLKLGYESIPKTLFRKDDFFQFLSARGCLNDVALKVDTAELKLGRLDGYKPCIEMRFTFSKTALGEEMLATMQPDQYISIISDHVPQSISLPLLVTLASEKGLLDENRDSVNFSEVTDRPQYQISVFLKGSKIKLDQHEAKELSFGDTVIKELVKVTFLGNDPNVVAWQPLEEIEECEKNQFILTNLKTVSTYVQSAPPNPTSPFLNKKSYDLLATTALACPCENAGILKTHERDELIKVLGFLYNPPDQYIPNTLSGKVILTAPYEIKAKNAVSEMENLEKNFVTLNLLEGLVRLSLAKSVDYHVDSNMVGFLNDISLLRNALIKNRDDLRPVILAEADIKKHYIKSLFLASPKDVGAGSTEIFNFMTASKFKIVPDFGFVVISDIPNIKSVNELVPYLGFNVNFRSIDKDIAMRKIQGKHWTYYFSFIVGLTLTSIDIPDKREDLFGNNSLMTGFGFKANNYLKVILGGVFYKTYPINPLVDKKSIGVSAFAGLSVDYELKEIFGGIKSLFK